MKKFKRFGGFLCALALVASCLSGTVFAAAADSVPEVMATEAEDVGFQPVVVNEAETIPAQEFEELENITQTFDSELADVEGTAISKSRTNWAISDPVFVGNSTLNGVFDAYVVNLSSNQLAFLKLNSSNPNLIAELWYVQNGMLYASTGWRVNANGGASYINVPAGQYAIVIGSVSGTETGDYKLMWNCSNPSGASNIINVTDDLSRVVLLYDLSTIKSNGENILDDLKWEEHETWYTSAGYSARDMSMTMTEARGIYLGSFSSSAPYYAPNALLVDVQQGSWLYRNSYYRNVGGDVTHVMDYFDPSGLKTPRTFGEGYADFSYGPNYIVINLDTFEVCEFLSPFNYHYTTDGGRTFSLTNLRQIA